MNSFPYELNRHELEDLQVQLRDDPDRYVYDNTQLHEEYALLCNLLKNIDLDRLDDIRVKKAISQEELDQIMDKHEAWLRGEKSGERADLSNLDLSYLDIHDRNLSGADFKNARLCRTDMFNSDFVSCDFRRADMESPHIEHSCFYDADMRGAKMIGLYPQDICFHGAHLDSKQLANGILHFATDEEVEKMREHIKKPLEMLQNAQNKHKVRSGR